MIHLIQATKKNNEQLYTLYDSISNKQTYWDNTPDTQFHTTEFQSIDDFYRYIEHTNPEVAFSILTVAPTLPPIINSYPELFL